MTHLFINSCLFLIGRKNFFLNHTSLCRNIISRDSKFQIGGPILEISMSSFFLFWFDIFFPSFFPLCFYVVLKLSEIEVPIRSVVCFRRESLRAFETEAKWAGWPLLLLASLSTLAGLRVRAPGA